MSGLEFTLWPYAIMRINKAQSEAIERARSGDGNGNGNEGQPSSSGYGAPGTGLRKKYELEEGEQEFTSMEDYLASLGKG